jgi:hypothetical protein
MSAHQLHRMLGITYKSAWFMAHRIREGMTNTDSSPMGGNGKVIEADETYYGPKTTRVGRKPRRGHQAGSKQKIVTLVERNGGARSFHVENVDSKTIRKVLLGNASPESRLMTDEAGVYPSIGLQFADHKSVMHSADEYVRGDVHTNTIEGFFSIFKRGMKGVY